MNFFKDTQTNWKYILIMVILAVIVGGGILGYQYWQNWQRERTKEVVFNWKIYTDKENKYEIEYPDNWRMEVYEKPHELAISQGIVRWLPPWIPSKKIDVVIEVNVAKKQEGYSIPVILGFGEDIMCENIEIGDLTFCKLVKKSEKANVLDIIAYSLLQNDKIYTIGIFYELPENEIQLEFQIFNQMLSSFRFLE